MKNIAVFIFISLLISCNSDFLSLYPENQSNEGNFFKTENHFTQALNGAYTSLRDISAQQGFLMGEMRSDNTHYTRYKPDRGIHILYRENIADFIGDDQNQWVGYMWTGCYTGISRTNTIIDRISKSDLSDNFKNEILGQAHFLRAFYYFQLAQCFGGVPLQLSEVTDASTAFPGAKKSIDEVYTAIIDDVTDAIEKLPVVSFPQNGKANKGAAKMLYAYVLMTKPNPDQSLAETQLKDILKMGYELLPNYADVFDPNNKYSKEHIFSVQHLQGDQGQQSMYLYWFIPKSSEAKVITGLDASNTLLTGGWNVPTPAMIDSYEKDDKRLNPSIAIAVGDLDGDAMTIEKVLEVNDPEIEDFEIARPFVNKYNHPHAKLQNTDDNWPIYRYSDALLLLSECLVNQGKSNEALPYINQVRKRAGLPNLSNVTAQDVAKERKHELAFENHRWYDLLRTGEALNVMTEYAKYIKTFDPELPDRTYQIKKEYLLYPIPYRELQINKELVQNPGY